MFRTYYDLKAWIARKRGKVPCYPTWVLTPEEYARIPRALILGAVGGVSGPMVSVRQAFESVEKDDPSDQ